jgi:hypothetical protein
MESSQPKQVNHAFDIIVTSTRTLLSKTPDAIVATMYRELTEVGVMSKNPRIAEEHVLTQQVLANEKDSEAAKAFRAIFEQMVESNFDNRKKADFFKNIALGIAEIGKRS